MKKRTFIIIGAAVAFSVIAVASLRNNIFSPYVSLRTALENPEKHVQLIGKVKKSSVIYTDSGYTFLINDEEKNELPVFKTGMKPLNFEHADQVVVIGAYDSSRQVFLAQKVLTKCPSRYTKGK